MGVYNIWTWHKVYCNNSSKLYKEVYLLKNTTTKSTHVFENMGTNYMDIKKKRKEKKVSASLLKSSRTCYNKHMSV